MYEKNMNRELNIAVHDNSIRKRVVKQYSATIMNYASGGQKNAQ
jgi:hypothetical protein